MTFIDKTVTDLIDSKIESPSDFHETLIIPLMDSCIGFMSFLVDVCGQEGDARLAKLILQQAYLLTFCTQAFAKIHKQHTFAIDYAILLEKIASCIEQADGVIKEQVTH